MPSTTPSLMRRPLPLLAALMLASALALAGPRPAHAATITVSTTDDELNGDGDCSLREAIRAANLDAAVDACPAGRGDDTVVIPPGTYRLTREGREEDAAATGDLDIAGELTLSGAGPQATILDGSQGDRVIDILPTGRATIAGLTVRNGMTLSTENGAGISNRGSLTLTDSWVTGNTAPLDALASASFGGGIFNAGTLLLSGSTLSGNYAYFGAGLFNRENDATLVNSTISDNTSYSSGSGIYNDGRLRLESSTVSDNKGEFNSAFSIGVANFDGTIFDHTVVMRNTIIARNSFRDCAGTFQSEGHNLIQVIDGCTVVGDTTGNLIGPDPELGPLMDNGGPTPTRALLPGSPAVDVGSPTGCPAVDQRGSPRPTDGTFTARPLCDIGAFELEGDPPPLLNMLENGTFEAAGSDGALAGWSADPRATRSAETIHSGAYALGLQASDDASYSVSQDLPVAVEGATYRVNGWVNIPPTAGPFTFTLRLLWRSGGGRSLGSTVVARFSGPTDGWTFLTGTAVAPPQTWQMRLVMDVQGRGSTIYVDDLALLAENMLANPSFEADRNGDGYPDGWSRKSFVSWSAATAHAGGFSLRHSSDNNAYYTIWQTIPSPQARGDAYRVVAWVYQVASTDRYTVRIEVGWRDRDNRVIGVSRLPRITGPTQPEQADVWREVTAQVKAPYGTRRATLRVVVESLRGTLYIDDLTLQPVNPAAGRHAP